MAIVRVRVPFLPLVRTFARAQLVHYLLGNALVMLVRSVSLLALARLLLPAEYGRLNLTLTTVGLLVPLATLGVPQAAVRYLQEFRQQGRLGLLKAALLAETATAGAVVALALVVFAVAFPGGSQSRLIGPVLAVAAAILFCSSLTEAALGVFRATNQASRFALGRTAQVAGGAALGIGAVLLLSRTAQAYVWGQALAELTVAFFLIWLVRKDTVWKAVGAIRGALAQTLRYGAPHVLVLFASLLLSTGNRYVVGWLLDESAVATYVFGFLIASSVMSLLNIPLNLFIFPAYMQRRRDAGPEAVASFLSRVADLYLMVAVPLVFVALIVSREVVVLFGTAAYAEAAGVVPPMLAGLMFYGLFLITVAPFYAHDKVLLVGLITLALAVGNLLLSVGLVHWMGVQGAAVANLVSYVVHFLVITSVGSSLLRIPWRPRETTLYLALAAGLWLVSLAIPQDMTYFNLLYAVMFFPFFAGLVYLLSGDKRRLVHSYLR